MRCATFGQSVEGGGGRGQLADRPTTKTKTIPSVRTPSVVLDVVAKMADIFWEPTSSTLGLFSEDKMRKNYILEIENN